MNIFIDFFPIKILAIKYYEFIKYFKLILIIKQKNMNRKILTYFFQYVLPNITLFSN